MWIVGLSRFVIVVVLRPLLQDEPELQPDEERVWSLALSEDLFSEWEERKKSRAERCRCACHPLQTHILHTFSFILVSA